MRIMMLGLNHRTASLDLRERMVMPDDAFTRFRETFSHSELILLSTCNRTEAYVARPAHQAPSFDELRQFLCEQSGVSEAELAGCWITREGEQAVRHLMRVAAGLDSLVLGEPQILGQVKRAYDRAVAEGTVGSVLHQVAQKSLQKAKQVRSQTNIGQGRTSLASAAMDFAQQIFETFEDKRVLAIGVGEMTKTMLARLRELKPGRVTLVNRSSRRAAELAGSLALKNATVEPVEQLDRCFVEADIILSATGAPRPLLTVERCKPLIRKRRKRPLFIVDLALPRDVEPGVGSLANVFLYDLEALQQVIGRTQAQRRDEIAACEAEIHQAVRQVVTQVRHADVGRLVRQLRGRLSAIATEEERRLVRKLRNADPDEVDALVRQHSHRVVNKILHLPLSQLHAPEAGGGGERAARADRGERAGQGEQAERSTASGSDAAASDIAASDMAASDDRSRSVPTGEADSPSRPASSDASAETGRGSRGARSSSAVSLGFYAAALRRLFALEDEPTAPESGARLEDTSPGKRARESTTEDEASTVEPPPPTEAEASPDREHNRAAADAPWSVAPREAGRS